MCFNDVSMLPAWAVDAAINGETGISAVGFPLFFWKQQTCSLTVKVRHQNLTFTIEMHEMSN